MAGRWMSEDDVNTDFYEVRVSADRPLDDATAQALFACVGYAFRQHLRGEDLWPPHLVGPAAFTAYYDVTKSASDDWLARLDDALAAARRYAVEGSPPRKSAGNTRLAAGIGPVKLRFAFR